MKRLLLIAAVATLSGMYAMGEGKPNNEKMLEKLQNIILDHIEFQDAAIPSVFQQLQKQSAKLDPDGKGVPIVLDQSVNKLEEDNAPTVTMIVDDIPLGHAISYLCRASNQTYVVERDRVVVSAKNKKKKGASQSYNQNVFETRIYPLEQEVINKMGGEEDPVKVERYFRDRGVRIPPGAHIVYDNRISRLIATNTSDELEKIERIVCELNVIDPLVRITYDVIKINEKDIPKEVREDSWKTLLASNKYELISSMSLQTLNGQEAVFRIVTEKYFPESWSIPTDVKDEPTKAGADTCLTAAPPIPQFGDPTELGTVLRITPNVDADQYTIHVEANPVIQTQTSWMSFRGDKEFLMPELQVFSNEASLTAYDDSTILIGTNTRQNDHGERISILSFLSFRLVNPDGAPIRDSLQQTTENAATDHAGNETIIENSAIDDATSMETRFFTVRAPLIYSMIGQTENNGDEEKKESEDFSDTPDQFDDDAHSDNLSESLRKYFTDRGVRFPIGSTIAYDRHAGKLVVRNTLENHRRLESLLVELDVSTPLVLVNAVFLEIPQKELIDVLGDAEASAPFDSRTITKLLESKVGRILAAPKFITTSGNTANIRMCREEYFPESWTLATTTSSNGKTTYTPPYPVFGDPTDVGIRVEATPNVSPNNYAISFSLDPSISKLIGWTEYPVKCQVKNGEERTEVIKMPEIARVDFSCHVKVYDGEYVMIARARKSTKHTPPDRSIDQFCDCDSLLNQLDLNKMTVDGEVSNLFFFVKTTLVSGDGVPVRKQ